MCLNLVLLLGALQLCYSQHSPRSLRKNGNNYLKCLFKGWPRPRVAWYKDKKPIMNGSEGIYHTERLSKNDQGPSHYVLHFPAADEKYEGLYSCVAENSIPGWSSKQSSLIRVTYVCK